MNDNKCIISNDIERMVAILQKKKDTLNSLEGFAERVRTLYDIDREEALDVFAVAQGFIFGFIDSDEEPMSRQAFFEKAEEVLRKYTKEEL